MDLALLKPLALKVWAIKKYEAWEKSLAKKWGDEAEALLKEVLDEDVPDSIQRWPAAIEERLNYMMARNPVVQSKTTDPEPEAGAKGTTEGQDELDVLLPTIREFAQRYLCRGYAVWLMQGDGSPLTVTPKPELMDFIRFEVDDSYVMVRKYTETEIDIETGAEKKTDFFEVFRGLEKFTFSNAMPEKDTVDKLATAPVFIEIGKPEGKSMYATVRAIMRALNRVFLNQDGTVLANTKPLVEVKGYSGTDPHEARTAIETAAVILTEGQGGATVHNRAMDSNSIQLWEKRLLEQFYEGTGTVGKARELEYAISGKALDRLFVTAEQAAIKLGDMLEPAVKKVLTLQGVLGSIDIVWNTDRPTDDAAAVDMLMKIESKISNRTFLEQLPMIEDVDQELERIAEEQNMGFEDLLLQPGITPVGNANEL